MDRGRRTLRSSPEKRMSKHRASPPFSIARHRQYGLFFAGQLISLIGTWVQPWLVYRAHGFRRPAWTGRFRKPDSGIPVVAASWHDRRDRPNRHRMTARHILLLAASLGVVNAFDIPAHQSLLVEMVPRAVKHVQGPRPHHRILRGELRHILDPVCHIAHLLPFCRASIPRQLRHDASDGVVKHLHPGDGARRTSSTSDGRLLNDVHGDGALRLWRW